MSTFAARILLSIAADLNKPASTVQTFIDKLEENWFDTKESLQAMKDSDYEKLQIPLRIAQLIKDKVNQNPGSKQIQEEKKEQIIQKPKSPQEELKFQITVMRTELQQNLLQSLKIIHKILSNIVENPLNSSFYEIKLTSKTLNQNIMAYNSAWKFMQLCGWDNNGQSIVLNQSRTDIQTLGIACEVLFNEIEKLDKNSVPQFDPYKASFSSVNNQPTNSEIARREGYDVYSFADQLERLKQKRLVKQKI